jgi:two-component system, LuxR family, response regulator FixJ
MMTHQPPVVHVVDDDTAFLRSVLFMLEGGGFDATGYPSADDFLAAKVGMQASGGCLLLDIRMPRMSGLALQQRLNHPQPHPLPIVFMTGHGDIEQAVQAMKAGAFDFLQKPFKEQTLFDTLNRAVESSLLAYRSQQRQWQARDQVDKLSPREREVMKHLAMGLSNKEVAKALGISDHTVHIHRQRITEKIGSGHAADLARLLLRADPSSFDAE